MARSATTSRSRTAPTRKSATATRSAPAKRARPAPARPARPAARAAADDGERKLPRRKPSPGISRVDQEATRTHGYAARVGYAKTDSGWRPRHTAFFGDRSHGNPTKALKAAEEWVAARRDEDERATRRGRSPRAAAGR